MKNLWIFTAKPNFLPYLFGASALILAYDPIRWLIQTWKDPSYDSHGYLVFLLTLGLFLWGLSGKQSLSNPIDKKIPYLLLGCTSLIRLAGQVFAINIVGALTLVIDVYALGLLTGIQKSKRPVSPGWTALFFAFSLPLERVLQRSIGFGLQSLSADGACGILSQLFGNVSCQGVRIIINHHDVLVDLPCSGARGLLILFLLFCGSMAIIRPSLSQSALGIVITLVSGILENILRIVFIAIGVVTPSFFLNVDVLASPWHDLLGLSFLFLGSIPILIWSQWVYLKPKNENKPIDQILSTKKENEFFLNKNISPDNYFFTKRLFWGFGFLMFSLFIVSAPQKPIDVAESNLNISLPEFLNGHLKTPVNLLPNEKLYFTKFGGTATKAAYGTHSLLVVKTSAPLRHLHSPEECLRGLGMKVQYKGITYQSLPSAIYKVTNSNGKSYRVAVSFISDRGEVTSNISEAIWRWFKQPTSIWSEVQRISPWNLKNIEHTQWDEAVITALDIEKPKTAQRNYEFEKGRFKNG